MIALAFCIWILAERPSLDSVSSGALLLAVWQIANLLVLVYRAGRRDAP